MFTARIVPVVYCTPRFQNRILKRQTLPHWEKGIRELSLSSRNYAPACTLAPSGGPLHAKLIALALSTLEKSSCPVYPIKNPPTYCRNAPRMIFTNSFVYRQICWLRTPWIVNMLEPRDDLLIPRLDTEQVVNR